MTLNVKHRLYNQLLNFVYILVHYFILSSSYRNREYHHPCIRVWKPKTNVCDCLVFGYTYECFNCMEIREKQYDYIANLKWPLLALE